MNYLYIFLGLIVLLPSCVSPQYENTTKGVVYGSATGAFIGQQTGKDFRSTLKGAVIGGVAGGTAGYIIDNQKQERTKKTRNMLTISLNGDVTFEENSYHINPFLYPEIDRIVNILKSNQQNILIEGHSDNLGSKFHNMKLSKRRAEEVKKLFIRKGIKPSMIKVLAFGELHPRASNNTKAGRQLNRRVEIKIIPLSNRDSVQNFKKKALPIKSKEEDRDFDDCDFWGDDYWDCW
ncbi:OmpA/MotB domain containing protein [Candidatus Magnetomorum sp. HK-1]|nr:OmpA/MotB domain containing protein [Candidatus Magnetomorum sp. HK-1]